MHGNDKLDFWLLRLFRLGYVAAAVAVIVLMALSITGIFSPAGAQSEVPPTNGAPFDLPVGSEYIMATLVVGFLMSAAVSFFTGSSWQPPQKAVGAFALCLLAAVILLFAGGQLDQVKVDGHSLFGTFLVIFLMTINLYNFYFKPSGIAAKLNAAGPVK